MAIVVRRYRSQSTTDEALTQSVGSSASVVRTAPGVVDISIDDAVGGALETLDEFMAKRGLVLDDAAVSSPQTSIQLISPNGTVYAITISDLGVLEFNAL